MSGPIKLGGFKILKNAVELRLLLPRQSPTAITAPLELLAAEEINVPYLALHGNASSRKLEILLDAEVAERGRQVLAGAQNCILERAQPCAALSLFPHQYRPEILSALLRALDGRHLVPVSLTQSPSALSVVVEEEAAQAASESLFGPFQFSAYRSPEDWKSVQEGKERLYKEVVASFKEKRPKVYGLEWRYPLTLSTVYLTSDSLAELADGLHEMAHTRGEFVSLAAGDTEVNKNLVLQVLHGPKQGEVLGRAVHSLKAPAGLTAELPVAAFSMNGPHFGDRYGLALKLLRALQSRNISLLVLACSIASITGVVPLAAMDEATQAIQDCFDVPCVTNRSCEV